MIGTGVLLDAARELGVPRYLQVSTDEVYGSIQDGSVHRDVPARPFLSLLRDQGGRRPAVSAHHHTYGTEAVISAARTTRPRQYPRS